MALKTLIFVLDKLEDHSESRRVKFLSRLDEINLRHRRTKILKHLSMILGLNVRSVDLLRGFTRRE